MNVTASVVVIMGLLGQPAQTIQRDMVTDGPIIGHESEVCRQAIRDTYAALASSIHANPTMMVSIRCTAERGA